MTLANILADVYRRMNLNATPASSVITRITAFINETQQELASEPGLASLLRGTMPFSTEADIAEYGFPSSMARVVAIREASNNTRLQRRSLDWYRWAVPDASQQTGTPDSYVSLGTWKPVLRQPDDVALSVVSSAAGDTQVAYYDVVVGTGGTLNERKQGSHTLTGTTPSDPVSGFFIQQVEDFYLASAAVGTVRLTLGAAGATIAAIAPGQTRATYPWLAFAPTPSAAVEYLIDYEYDATDLVNTTDEPAWIPARFHRLLAMGARKKEYEKTDETRYAVASKEFDIELAKLLAYVNNPPDAVLVPGGRGRSGYSDLGGWYPSGTIFD